MSSLDIHYNPITLYVNQLQKNTRQNGYLKIAFPTKTNTPNIVIGESEYVSTNLYIFDKLHYDLHIDHDAIMIIEHSSITNDFQTLYLCIPLLESSSSQSTDLDILIESTDEGPISIDISKYLKKGDKCVVYENEGLAYNDYVIVAMQPISVKTNLMGFSTKPTMIEDINMNDPIQTISISSPPSSPIVEGMQDDIPMICTQIIEEGDEVMYEPVLQLSGKSGAGNDILNSQGFIYLKILIQLLIVIFIPIFIVPMFIVPKISFVGGDGSDNVTDGIHGFFFVAFLVLSILIISTGFAINNSNEGILGIYLFVMVCLSKYMTNNISLFGSIRSMFKFIQKALKWPMGIGISLIILAVSVTIPSILNKTKIIDVPNVFVFVLGILFVLFFITVMAGVYDLT